MTVSSQDQAAPDVETMRATIQRALALAAPPTAMDVTLLLGQLRDEVELMVSEVELLATAQADTMAGTLAQACVGEARRKLSVDVRPVVSARLAYGRRLARVLSALCDHYRSLTGGA